MTRPSARYTADESIGAAVGARCAARQEAFWPYHDSLFANQRGENQGAFLQPTLIDIAGLVGLDQRQFSTCLADPAVRAAVIAETGQGHGIPVNATPTLVVAGQVIEGVPSLTALNLPALLIAPAFVLMVGCLVGRAEAGHRALANIALTGGGARPADSGPRPTKSALPPKGGCAR